METVGLWHGILLGISAVFCAFISFWEFVDFHESIGYKTKRYLRLGRTFPSLN